MLRSRCTAISGIDTTRHTLQNGALSRTQRAVLADIPVINHVFIDTAGLPNRVQMCPSKWVTKPIYLKRRAIVTEKDG
jgi:hypothetical protein